MLALVRNSSRSAKTRPLSIQLLVQLQPQLPGLSYQSRSYSGGNQRKLRPINTALLAAGSPSSCPSGPVRSLPSYHNLFSARSITCSACTCTSFFASPPRTTLSLSRPPVDSSDIDKSFFSTSRAVMGATKIDGTAIAKRIREGLHADIQDKRKINPRFVPSLKIIQGDLIPSISQSIKGSSDVSHADLVLCCTVKSVIAVTLVSPQYPSV